MDINRAYQEAKSLPTEYLEKELQSPSGMIPEWVVLSEMHSRKSMGSRKTPRMTVRDEMMMGLTPKQSPVMPQQGFAEGGLVSYLNPFLGMDSFGQMPDTTAQALEMAAIRQGNQPRLQKPQAPQQLNKQSGIAALSAPQAPPELRAPIKLASGGLATLNPYQRAFLDAIAAKESAQRYNVMYGGKTFSDYSDHPRIGSTITSGPNRGKVSRAAGKYQFIPSTWDEQAAKLGLTDFSPENQDLAAWDLAATRYAKNTGGDLNAVVQSGDPRLVAEAGSALRDTWTSLPGGIESGTNSNGFVSAYMNALQSQSVPPDVANQMSAPINVAQAAQSPNSSVGDWFDVSDTEDTGGGGLGALVAAQMLSRNEAPPPPLPTTRRQEEDEDPYALAALTSQTPDAYFRRSNYG